MKKHIIYLIFTILISITAITAISAQSTNDYQTEDLHLNFVQISDTHLDDSEKSNNSRMYEFSSKLLKDAIKQTNQLDNIDFVVFTGDMVNTPSIENYEEFAAIANTLNVPWYFTVGNHDTTSDYRFTKDNLLETLGYLNDNFNFDSTFYSIPFKNKYLLIFMDGAVENKNTAMGYYSKEELKWLNDKLANNPDKNVIIFQHFPVVEPFKSNSHKVYNSSDYLDVLDKYGNVLAVVTGHYHSNKITKRNNVIHVSSPSLVQYPNAFRVFSIKETEELIELEINSIETGLKEIQAESKSKHQNYSLAEGEEKDRSLKIYLYKAF